MPRVVATQSRPCPVPASAVTLRSGIVSGSGGAAFAFFASRLLGCTRNSGCFDGAVANACAITSP